MAGRARPPREDPAHVGDGSQGKPGPGSSGSVGGTSCSTSSRFSSPRAAPRAAPAAAPRNLEMSHARARHRAPAQADFRPCQGTNGTFCPICQSGRGPKMPCLSCQNGEESRRKKFCLARFARSQSRRGRKDTSQARWLPCSAPHPGEKDDPQAGRLLLFPNSPP